jgi:hypothetical protein
VLEYLWINNTQDTFDFLDECASDDELVMAVIVMKIRLEDYMNRAHELLDGAAFARSMGLPTSQVAPCLECIMNNGGRMPTVGE